MSNAHQCSAEFSEAFSGHMSSCRHVCCCGREWFDNYNSGIDWEEGELERLEAKQKSDPDKCTGADGSISWMEIDGKSIVWGCKCDTAKKYESFLLRHQTQIADYLRRRSKRLKEEADAINVE